MKALLRHNYEWVDVKFNVDKTSLELEGGATIKQTSIIAIEDDCRDKYVKCKHCGEIIRNTARAIESHYSKAESSEACLSCSSMRERNGKTIRKKYILNEDGTYTTSTKIQCNLMCLNGAGSYDINSESARRVCRYARCRERGVEPLQDIFLQNPGLFDKIATVDALDMKKWSLKASGSGGYTFAARKRFTLLAYVNSLGIIDYFVYKYHNDVYKFMYSAKYNRIVWVNGSTYSERNSYVDAIRTREILDTVAQIYKE